MTLSAFPKPAAEGRVGPIRALHVVSLLGHGGMETGVMKAERGFSRERMIEDYTQMYESVAGCLRPVPNARRHEPASTTAQDAIV